MELAQEARGEFGLRAALAALELPCSTWYYHQRPERRSFTSHAWTARVLLEHGIRLSYALRGARDNPEMESFFGRFKVENRSLLLDAETLAELKAVVAQRIAYHNHDRRHSSLANTTPAAFLSRWWRVRRSQT